MSKKRIKELDQEIARLTEERNELESRLNLWCPFCKKGTKAKDIILFRMRYAEHCYDGTDWNVSKDVEYLCKHCDRVIALTAWGKPILPFGKLYKVAITHCKKNLIYKGWIGRQACGSTDCISSSCMSEDDKKAQFAIAIERDKLKENV